MHSFREQALEILAEFPASAARSALQDLVNFTTERSY
jgi:geranylgeranyl pyrophosphate synthase